MLAGGGLHPSSKGARVRFEGQKRTVIDGPFAETKELVAGFLALEVCVAAGGDRMGQALSESCARAIRDRDSAGVFEAEDFGPALTPELREQEERLPRGA
jgi:hypothetical protein